MTATSFSLKCFVTLLIWGYHAAEMMTANTTYGEIHSPIACGNTSDRCTHICDFCYESGLTPMDCLSTLFGFLCISNFETHMGSLNSTDWCIWDKVIKSYSNFSLCTEEMSDCLMIPWPNPLVETTFVDIHSKFFKDCPTEELSDPPPVIVFALVITPICLIPVMVSLVVLKTKNGDGSS